MRQVLDVIMGPDELDALLQEFQAGDGAAIEKVFLAVAADLRKAVDRTIPARLRTKVDADDIVQSVWTRLLPGFRRSRWEFESAGHLRAFLLKATRNRLLEGIRRHRGAMNREEPLCESAGADARAVEKPRPSAFARAGELQERLLTMCPQAHREIVRLRLKGLHLAEIAARTGFHESSIRRILYDLARRLNAEQSALLIRPGVKKAGVPGLPRPFHGKGAAKA